MKAKAIFSACWVDADNCIHLRLCHTHLEGNSHTLGYLTSIRASYVETNDFVVDAVDQDLSVSETLGVAKLVVFPLKRYEFGVPRIYIFGTILLNCLIFVQADRAVFERCEHSGWHGDVVHQSLTSTHEALAQK